MTNFERIKEKGTSIESPPISMCVRSFKDWLESEEI